MLKTVALILAVVGAQPADTKQAKHVSSPAEALRLAAADIGLLPEAVRPQTRYLSLYNIDPKKREEFLAVSSFVLNSAGQSYITSSPTLICGGALIRLDLAAFANQKDPASYQAIFAAWERLASVDPYFHLRTQVATPEGVKEQTVPGGWAGLETADALYKATGSFGAILRADWFIDKITRPPTYYEWLGVADNETQFLKDVGIDPNVINRLAADQAANIGKSGVTNKPRRILHKPGPLGPVWITRDVAIEGGNKDPFRSPVNFKEQKFDFDASEVFYMKANGFWGTILFDGKGKRVDAAPPNVATDVTAPPGHQELVPFISCVRCHELNGGKNGLQPFKDEQTLLSIPDSYEIAVSVRMRELYDPVKIQSRFVRGQEDYETAVLAATGMKPPVVTALLAEIVSQHAYGTVTPEVAACELGLTVDELQAALCVSTDPTTKAILLGLPVTRSRFETAFQDPAILAQNYLISKGNGGPK